ncbi:Uncharacterised protein [Streptococcus constellatus]|uniref:Uncharacterized protein n=1 Tax=Streptococcus constellatus TaxID=76860 RepID=A0A564TWX8_STRCV|nr:hypothetical protein [Streptococcus constellatus]VUX09400.1 Uncharacterised protein [Streptococcus gordonii]VUX11734.1 Uncharacterised protein [Streptococcus constellatus]
MKDIKDLNVVLVSCENKERLLDTVFQFTFYTRKQATGVTEVRQGELIKQ